MASVLYEPQGPLAVIRLNRPDVLNAIDNTMIAAIEEGCARAVADPDIFAIGITGTGRGFCAGLDMTLLAAYADAGRLHGPEGPPPPLFGFLRSVPKPVIALVNGPAAGGGFILAMMADLRFASTDAVFTTSFTRRGLVAEHQASWLLPRIVGLGRATDLMLSGRKMDAEEAYRIGFADRLIDPEVLVEHGRNYAEDLALHAAPRAMAIVKAQIGRDLSLAEDAAWALSAEQISASLGHPDATEGALSFVERRKPRFTPFTGDLA
ncbi:enoyl-CoA hydratase-related protein [Novosphingobium sp. KCTC 2891]|uniref:enoyl-CoA hydratase-related protein n=1 Tax=Novosphingobium sp. KCTC 2891 TaxID=2989730 RepID=UPI0022227E96|nr:enoyl-CoA hydratase-related protein [Novosphingobium sp. KCTC 2891]MCW1381645.1 enoyl-CoA hydratase-related protein [Novosphingobium sp. KCTC 2891]